MIRVRFSSRLEQQIRPQASPFYIAKLNRIVESLNACPRHGFSRIATAENFRRVKKRHAVSQAAQQE